MIKTIFTLANTLARHTRISPTAIVEGRNVHELEDRVQSNQELDTRKEAYIQALKARHANTEDPFIREKQQVLADFVDDKNPTNFEEAWLRLDEVEQRQSEEGWRNFKSPTQE